MEDLKESFGDSLKKLESEKSKNVLKWDKHFHQFLCYTLEESLQNIDRLLKSQANIQDYKNIRDALSGAATVIIFIDLFY